MIQNEFSRNVLETSFRQRAFDGKWERLVRFLDHENKYKYVSDTGQRVSIVPEKWVCVGVYDYLIEMEE